MSRKRAGGTRGDVGAATDGDTYVHGAGSPQGPRTTQSARSGVGTREERMVPPQRPRSYYGRPVVKPPVWKPEIPWYFFSGGLGGAAAALALAASRLGNQRLAERSWEIALAGMIASPALLISDLGRPARFLHMLRVFKVTSPMSVGSWLLSLEGAAVTTAVVSRRSGAFERVGAVAELAAGALGLPLATYTAVLISNTAVPVWSEARLELPLVFAGGAAASAGAAAAALTPVGDAGPARRLAVGGAVLEEASTVAMERRLGELGAPYRRGVAGRYARAAKALTLAGAVTMAVADRRIRARPHLRRPSGEAGFVRAAAAILLAGAVLKRWAVFKAGFASASDPAHTVGPQRRRISPGQASTPSVSRDR